VEDKGRKEGEGGRPATNLWLIGHVRPPLDPYFHPPLRLVPIMHTPLIKNIKSKASSFHPFPKFYLFVIIIYFFEFFYFILCNDEVNMLWKRSK
jgi:hypothetical protein